MLMRALLYNHAGRSTAEHHESRRRHDGGRPKAGRCAAAQGRRGLQHESHSKHDAGATRGEHAPAEAEQGDQSLVRRETGLLSLLFYARS